MGRDQDAIDPSDFGAIVWVVGGSPLNRCTKTGGIRRVIDPSSATLQIVLIHICYTYICLYGDERWSSWSCRASTALDLRRFSPAYLHGISSRYDHPVFIGHSRPRVHDAEGRVRNKGARDVRASASAASPNRPASSTLPLTLPPAIQPPPAPYSAAPRGCSTHYSDPADDPDPGPDADHYTDRGDDPVPEAHDGLHVHPTSTGGTP